MRDRTPASLPRAALRASVVHRPCIRNQPSPTPDFNSTTVLHIVGLVLAVVIASIGISQAENSILISTHPLGQDHLRATHVGFHSVFEFQLDHGTYATVSETQVRVLGKRGTVFSCSELGVVTPWTKSLSNRLFVKNQISPSCSTYSSLAARCDANSSAPDTTHAALWGAVQDVWDGVSQPTCAFSRYNQNLTATVLWSQPMNTTVAVFDMRRSVSKGSLHRNRTAALADFLTSFPAYVGARAEWAGLAETVSDCVSAACQTQGGCSYVTGYGFGGAAAVWAANRTAATAVTFARPPMAALSQGSTPVSPSTETRYFLASDPLSMEGCSTVATVLNFAAPGYFATASGRRDLELVQDPPCFTHTGAVAWGAVRQTAHGGVGVGMGTHTAIACPSNTTHLSHVLDSISLARAAYARYFAS